MNNLIFILGCGHSGTTILNKVIGNHSNIYGINYETHLFVKNSDEEIISKLENFNRDRLKFKKKWICEKTPIHVYFIEKIFEITTNPKIIVIVRDGRDVVASLYKRYCDLNMSLSRWINDNTEWLKNSKKNMFHILKYEDFVLNPELEIKKICSYLEEKYDENIFNYKKEIIEIPEDIFGNQIVGRNHCLLRLYQINQNIYDGTKRYIRDLNEQQLEYLYSNQNFVNLMNKFEYLKS
jgi:hypothetical protein